MRGEVMQRGGGGETIYVYNQCDIQYFMRF